MNLGDGQDRINDRISKEERNVLQFGEGIEAEKVILRRKNDNLEILYSGEEDKVTVEYYFREYQSGILLPYALQEIQFADGVVWTMEDVLNQV